MYFVWFLIPYYLTNSRLMGFLISFPYLFAVSGSHVFLCLHKKYDQVPGHQMLLALLYASEPRSELSCYFLLKFFTLWCLISMNNVLVTQGSRCRSNFTKLTWKFKVNVFSPFACNLSENDTLINFCRVVHFFRLKNHNDQVLTSPLDVWMICNLDVCNLGNLFDTWVWIKNFLL